MATLLFIQEYVIYNNAHFTFFKTEHEKFPFDFSNQIKKLNLCYRLLV